MAKRTDSQRIGARGERLVAYMIESSGGWIVRSQDEDFGIDLEAEFAEQSVRLL